MHKHWEDLIPFYVAGTLSPKERNALEGHLMNCAECRQQIEEWRSIASAVWQTASEDARGLPPLSQHVLDAVRTAGNQKAVPTPPPQRVIPLPARHAGKNNWMSQLNRVSASVPLTLVAAVTAVMIVVGLLVYMSLPYEGDGDDIEGGTGVAVLSPSDVTATETPASVRDMGLILTPNLTFTPQPPGTPLPPIATNTHAPTAFPTVGGVGGGNDEDAFALSQSSIMSQEDTQLTACYAVNNQLEIVNIYALPGIQYEVVDALNPGERVEVFTGGANGWYQTIRIHQPRAITGWIDGGLITLEGICNDLPMPTPTQAGTTTSSSQQCLVSSASTSQGVNMYTGPGEQYDLLTTISPQVTANALAQSDNGWYQVSYTAFSRTWLGWVSLSEVQTYFNCNNLTVIRSEGYTPQLTPILGLTSTPAMVVTPTASTSDVVYFTVFPTTASAGDRLTLRWETRNAENIWIELYEAGDNFTSPSFVPDELYSDLSPTGTLTIEVPEDFADTTLQIALIIDRYDRVGRANGDVLSVIVE